MSDRFSKSRPSLNGRRPLQLEDLHSREVPAVLAIDPVALDDTAIVQATDDTAVVDDSTTPADTTDWFDFAACSGLPVVEGDTGTDTDSEKLAVCDGAFIADAGDETNDEFTAEETSDPAESTGEDVPIEDLAFTSGLAEDGEPFTPNIYFKLNDAEPEASDDVSSDNGDVTTTSVDDGEAVTPNVYFHLNNEIPVEDLAFEDLAFTSGMADDTVIDDTTTEEIRTLTPDEEFDPVLAYSTGVGIDQRENDTPPNDIQTFGSANEVTAKRKFPTWSSISTFTIESTEANSARLSSFAAIESESDDFEQSTRLASDADFENFDDTPEQSDVDTVSDDDFAGLDVDSLQEITNATAKKK